MAQDYDSPRNKDEIVQFRRLVGIQRLYQNLDVFRLVICFVERHQAAHS